VSGCASQCAAARTSISTVLPSWTSRPYPEYADALWRVAKSHVDVDENAAALDRWLAISRSAGSYLRMRAIIGGPREAAVRERGAGERTTPGAGLGQVNAWAIALHSGAASPPHSWSQAVH
jgi:hypothetical protein